MTGLQGLFQVRQDRQQLAAQEAANGQAEAQARAQLKRPAPLNNVAFYEGNF